MAYSAVNLEVPPGATMDWSFGMNASGEIAGMYASGSGDSYAENAIVWSLNGLVTGLIDGSDGDANAINNAGQVVGASGDPGYAYLWSSTGVPTLLQLP